ncbi:MAG: carbonic anhydrase [Sphingobacteriales bacterium]|jgi:carbonic anhydrase|nr:carbonic anhydrase [Sphingobacteriales bacterium]
MKSYEKLLEANKKWAAEKLKTDPEYFSRLEEVQDPEFFWIGCSDSRVPANVITGTTSGEIFVHRNIANVVLHTDVNLFSVLDYAVTELKVRHIIVCGHYGCGGIKAAMSNHDYRQTLNMWLRTIKDVYHNHQEELDAIEDLDKRADRLTELNVIDNIKKLAKTSVIQKAWKERQAPHLHGWVYGLKDGLINTVTEISPDISNIDPLYVYDDL